MGFLFYEIIFYNHEQQSFLIYIIWYRSNLLLAFTTTIRDPFPYSSVWNSFLGSTPTQNHYFCSMLVSWRFTLTPNSSVLPHVGSLEILSPIRLSFYSSCWFLGDPLSHPTLSSIVDDLSSSSSNNNYSLFNNSGLVNITLFFVNL